MPDYFHSVTLDDSLCKGCTNCIKRCPTEAIRIRDGKAHIIVERCIDCGECIRTCLNHAKTALTDDLSRLSQFEYRIALVPPSFHGLWRTTGESSLASARLSLLGFDAVFEVAIAADIVIQAMRAYLSDDRVLKPAISSSCPAVIRLMQVRFPTLLPNLVPFEAPMEIAGGLAKERAVRETGLSRDKIGAFFLTPCPAKVTAIKQPVGRDHSNLDGAIAMSLVFGALARNSSEKATPLSIGATESGLLWGRTGGEARSIAQRRGTTIAVDGIHSVTEVLDEVERGRLSDVTFIEAQACVGGCMGGCLTSQNPFVGRVRLNGAAEAFGSEEPEYPPSMMDELLSHGDLRFTRPIGPRPVMKLDPDLSRALEMMRSLEKTLEKLPGLDCGACGCPNCRALAEDIVRGHAFPEDCTFLLRERVRELAEEMVDLAKRVPPAIGEQGQRKNENGGGRGDS